MSDLIFKSILTYGQLTYFVVLTNVYSMVKISRREATWVVTEQDEVLGTYLTFREAFEAFDRIKHDVKVLPLTLNERDEQ